MITEISRTGAAISLDRAKRELRIRSRDFDQQLADNISEALRYVERLAQITLATTVQRKFSLPDWPQSEIVTSGGPTWWYAVQSPILLPHPPWSSTDSVTYFDLDDAEQTVNSANYNTRGSDTAPAELEFDETYTFPSLRQRRDAVNITYTTGSATPDPIGVQAAIQRLHFLFDGNADRRMECDRLLISLRNPSFGRVTGIRDVARG